MNKRTLTLIGAATLALLALVAGLMLVLAYGFTPPPWLLTAELAIGSTLALLVGFSACWPACRALRPWLRLRPVKGAALVVAGVAAMYVPPQFIASAVFLALGVRLVWAEACELAEAGNRAAVAAVIRDEYDLVTADSTAGGELATPGTAEALPTPARAVARRRTSVPASRNGGP